MLVILIFMCNVEFKAAFEYTRTTPSKHVYRHHREQLNPVLRDTSSTQERSTPSEISCGDDDGLDFLDPDNSDTGYDHTEQVALFVLKAEHVHKISQSALNDLLSTMISDRIHYVENKVHQDLQGSSSSSGGALEVFQHPAVVDPFHGLTLTTFNLSIIMKVLDCWYVK